MSFYLVQRLESKESTDIKRGFDGFFSLDYMGSSEFEWGAIPKALKSVREKKVVALPIAVTIDNETRTVYFVGHKDTLEAHAAAMETWAVEGERRPSFWGKERTYFPEQFAGNASDYQNRVDAWWAISADVAWALDEKVANKLVAAFNAMPAIA